MDTQTNSIVPIINVLMPSKSEILYILVFKQLLLLLKINNNKISMDQFTHVHADFETSQINAFRKVFGEKIIFVGCHFHYLNALYNKLKFIGLIKIKFKTFNKSLIAILRYVPCLHIDLRTKFFMT